MPTDSLASVTSLEALIRTKYMSVLYDNIFVKSHPLAAILKEKAKTYNGRQIGVPLEYADSGSGNVYWGGQHGATDLTPAVIDPFVLAKYEPKMLTGTLRVTKEEMLIMNSDEAVKNVVSSKVKNLQKTLEATFSSNLHAASASSGAWHSLKEIISAISGNSQTESPVIGGIAVTTDGSGDYSAGGWWQSPVINAETVHGDALTESDLLNASDAAYFPKLLARGVAQSRKQTGEDPNLIIVSQYLFDLLEQVLDPRKTGSKMNEKMGSMGFNSIDFRGIPVVADNHLTVASNKASIYFLNTDYLYMFFNSGAKFTAGKFVEAERSNTFSMKVHTYGQMACTNRKAHCRIDNVYSDGSYV
tara:strand:+ start:14511 stop:15587 length:1077 start_codon:yes stop_codon:yes gene_type:complete